MICIMYIIKAYEDTNMHRHVNSLCYFSLRCCIVDLFHRKDNNTASMILLFDWLEFM